MNDANDPTMLSLKETAATCKKLDKEGGFKADPKCDHFLRRVYRLSYDQNHPHFFIELCRCTRCHGMMHGIR